MEPLRYLCFKASDPLWKMWRVAMNCWTETAAQNPPMRERASSSRKATAKKRSRAAAAVDLRVGDAEEAQVAHAPENLPGDAPVAFPVIRLRGHLFFHEVPDRLPEGIVFLAEIDRTHRSLPFP